MCFESRIKEYNTYLPSLPPGSYDDLAEGDNKTSIPFWVWCRITSMVASTDMPTAVRCTQVCRTFFRAAQHNNVWKPICMERLDTKGESDRIVREIYGNWMQFFRVQTIKSQKTIILLAEDNYINTKLATTLLSRYNHYEVMVVTTGTKALEFIRSNHERIIFVMMDTEMPDMDGITCASLVRNFENEKDLDSLPMIAYSADESVEHMKQYLVNCNWFLSKPCNFSEFFDTADEAIRSWDLLLLLR